MSLITVIYLFHYSDPYFSLKCAISFVSMIHLFRYVTVNIFLVAPNLFSVSSTRIALYSCNVVEADQFIH